MDERTTRDDVTSLYGALRGVYIPQDLGFDDVREIGRALAAWRYEVSREDIQTLEYIAQGFTNAQIANRMGLAEENTMKSRIKKIFNKLGVEHRAQAAAIAVKYGFGPSIGPFFATKE